MRRHRKGSQKLNGFVPLMEMFGYATTLRNVSSGRANYSMEFYKYMPLNKAVQEEVLRRLIPIPIAIGTIGRRKKRRIHNGSNMGCEELDL